MHAVDPELHRALSVRDHASALEDVEALCRPLREYIAARPGGLRPADPELASYVAVRALEAVIHGTALDRPELLGHPDFVDEATQLLVGYLEA